MQKISILNLPVGVFKIDSNKQMIYVNKHFCKISGYSKEKLLGEQWLEVIHPKDLHTFIPALAECMSMGTSSKFEFRFMHHERDEVWVLCEITPETLDKTVSYIGTITDITDFKKTQAALQKLSRYDPLTQLPNRYLFEEMLIKCLMRAKRNCYTLALFYIDLDYFKNVNDFFGHGVGDAFLKEVGNRLKQSVRIEDFVARLGGDEFAIIMEDIHNLNLVSLAAQRIHDDFKAQFVVGEHEILSTLSIGISVYPEYQGEEATAESIVQRADQALYQAKKLGRNCYKYYNKTMQERLDRYTLVVKHLRNAIQDNQFELYYQPKIDAQQNSFVGMEALIRWNNPHIESTSEEFIQIAEETGLMNQIGSWIIKTALRQYKNWYTKFKKMEHVKISVNLSSSQLSDSSIIEHVTEILKETDIPAHNILFELTETALMKRTLDSQSILQVFLMELGIGISIDDFGVGYSSLTYLKKMPVKELKIDKSFIDDIGKDDINESIVKAIINLAKILGLEVTAEGVETKEQVAFLKENQCNIFQGYYFSRPLSVNEMTSYIHSFDSSR